MNVTVALAVLASLVVVSMVGCSRDDSEVAQLRSQVAALQTAAPTPDTGKPVREEVARYLETTFKPYWARIYGAVVLINSARWDRSDPMVTEQLAHLAQGCAAMPTGGPPHFEIWPAPYQDAFTRASMLCDTFASYQQDKDWELFKGIIQFMQSRLKTAFDAIPTYSPAELRRAIEARQ